MRPTRSDLLARRIEERHALLELAGIDAAEGEDAILVVHQLEGEHGQRLAVGGLAHRLFAGLDIDALDRRAVERRGQIVDYRIEQRLHALVLERRAAQHREEGAGDHGLAQKLLDRLVGNFLAVEIIFGRLLVELGAGLDHLLARRHGGRP